MNTMGKGKITDKRHVKDWFTVSFCIVMVAVAIFLISALDSVSTTVGVAWEQMSTDPGAGVVETDSGPIYADPDKNEPVSEKLWI